jgi:hypothetical protein
LGFGAACGFGTAEAAAALRFLTSGDMDNSDDD